MSKKDFDPLSSLFTSAQLSGLSGLGGQKKNKKANPLQVDFDALEIPKARKLHRPKTPPKPKDDIPEDALLEVDEIEESSEEEPPVLSDAPVVEEPIILTQTEPIKSKEELEAEVRLKIVLAQQELMRKKLKKEKEEQEKREQEQRKEQEKINQSEVAERLSQIVATEKKSAMDIFMAEIEEEKSKTPKPRKKSSSKTQKTQKSKKVRKEVRQEKVEIAIEQPIMGNRLILETTSLIKNNLPSLAQFHVANAMDSFNRPMLKTMWMAKRTQFLNAGQLEYAVAAASVIDALKNIDDGDLIAAYVETTASDYLIWVDRSQNRLVAAFADASTYFA